MTAHANVLTKRVTNADPMRPATQAASVFRTHVDALARLGYDSPALLRAAGIQPVDLEDPDGRIPCTAVVAVFAGAMRARPMMNLPMHVAIETPIGASPLVDYLMLTSETVGESLAQLSRYFRLTDFPVTLELHDDEDPIRAVHHGPRDRFGYEFGVTLAQVRFRAETEGRFRAEYVSFTHHPDDVAEMERVFGCPVRAEASWDGWAMSRAMWNLSLRRRDPILRGLLERHASEMMARLPSIGGTGLEVRRALATRVAGGDTRIGVIARALAMSARSLQRQLATEGLSYQALVDASKREAAERYLAESSLPIGEVAYLLGYSEPAAFHRAFKRWTRITPDAFRRARRNVSPSAILPSPDAM